MVRKQRGGNTTAVKDIMVNNLCRETKDGQTLKTKDSNSFVQIQNLCSTSNEVNMAEDSNNARSNISNSSNSSNSSNDQNNSQAQEKTNNAIFSGGSFIGNIGSMMSFPMRKAFELVGFDTSKLTENAKNKVSSMLNNNVEQKVQEDKGNTAVVNKGDIDEKIVKKLDNLSGGRRKTKKNGKKKGKSKPKGRAKKSKRQRG